MTNKLRIAYFSDIHLGANRTTTPEILAGLYDAFDKNQLFENIDVLIIAGDLFDRLLEVNNEHLRALSSGCLMLFDNVNVRILLS